MLLINLIKPENFCRYSSLFLSYIEITTFFLLSFVNLGFGLFNILLGVELFLVVLVGSLVDGFKGFLFYGYISIYIEDLL